MKELVEKLIKEGVLKTPNVIQSFLRNDRKKFVPKEFQAEAYVDAPLPIGEGQTISQPFTVAFMLELLDAQKGQKILDVGFGSGWTTALLAYIVGNDGRVYGLEIVPELFQFGAANLAGIFSSHQQGSSPHPYPLRDSPYLFPSPGLGRVPRARREAGEVEPRPPHPDPPWADHLLPQGEKGKMKIQFRRGTKGEVMNSGFRINNIVLFPQSGWEGLPDQAPFDQILVSAAAPAVPKALKDQLAVGGRLVAPIGGQAVDDFQSWTTRPFYGQSIRLIKKLDEKKFEEENYPGFAFVPLVK